MPSVRSTTDARKLRIAAWHNLPSGGGRRAFYDQIRGLVARGHSVDIWCPPTADRAFLPLDGIVQEHVVDYMPPPARKLGYVQKRVQFYTERYTDLVGKMAVMNQHCRACAEQITRGRFDLLFVAPCQMFIASPIACNVSIPTCFYVQEPNRPLYEALPRLPWVAPPPREGRLRPAHVKEFIKEFFNTYAKRVQAREELRWVSAFNTILVNSLFSRESVLRAYNLEAKVCYLGIDTTVFAPAGLPKEPYVIGLGSMHMHKGLHIAVAAVGSIEPAKRPTLVWVGNGADPNYLKRVVSLAEQLGVRFVAKRLVPLQELIDLLSRAACLVYTSRLEPFGYAPLEANACGTVVVAVAEGGVRESIRHEVNGLLLADSDPAAIGQAIQGLTDNLERATSFGRTARRFVEANWGYEASIDRLEQALYEVCRSGKSLSPSPLC